MLVVYFSNVLALEMLKEISALSERGVCDRPGKQTNIRQAHCEQFCGCEVNSQTEATLNSMGALFWSFIGG